MMNRPEISRILGLGLPHGERLRARRKLAEEASAIFTEVGSGSLGSSLTDDVLYGDRCAEARNAAHKKVKQ